MSKLIVTVTPTIMDGPVVRWHPSEAAALADARSIPVMTASRNGVLVEAYLHTVPVDAISDAQQAYRSLARMGHGDIPGDVAVLATHKRDGDRLVPVNATMEEVEDEAVRAG